MSYNLHQHEHTIGYANARYKYTEGEDINVIINSIIAGSGDEAVSIKILNAPDQKVYTFNSAINDKSASTGEFNQPVTIVGESKGGVTLSAGLGYRAEFFKTHNWATLIATPARGGTYRSYFDNMRIIYPFNTYTPQAITVQRYAQNNTAELGFDACFKIYGADIHLGENIQIRNAPEIGVMRAYASGDWALAPALTRETYNIVEDKIRADIEEAQVGSYLIWGSHDSFMTGVRMYSFSPDHEFFVKTDGTNTDLTGGSLQMRDIHTYGISTTPAIIASATCSCMDSEIEGGRVILNTSENKFSNNYHYFTDICYEVRTGDNTIDLVINKVNDTVEDHVIKLGDTTDTISVANNVISIRGNIVAGTNVDCKYIDFQGTNGYNSITVQSYKAVGALTDSDIYDGTPNGNDILDILVLSNGSPYESYTNKLQLPITLIGDESEAFKVQKADFTTMFNISSTNQIFEMVNGTDIKVFSDNYSTEVFKVEGDDGRITTTGEIETSAMNANGQGILARSGTGGAAIYTLYRQAHPSNGTVVTTTLGGFAVKTGTSTPATNNYDFLVDINGDAHFDANVDAVSYSAGGTAGASGTFQTGDNKTVTVTNGIITSIVTN